MVKKAILFASTLAVGVAGLFVLKSIQTKSPEVVAASSEGKAPAVLSGVAPVTAQSVALPQATASVRPTAVPTLAKAIAGANGAGKGLPPAVAFQQQAASQAANVTLPPIPLPQQKNPAGAAAVANRAVVNSAPVPVPRIDRAGVVPMVVMPAVNEALLIEQAEQIQKDRGIYRFAEKLPTNVKPTRDGRWERLANGNMAWSMEFVSAGATSLNFAFDEFELPPGAKLSIYPAGEKERAQVFTAADNDAHGEFWTPVFEGDRVQMDLEIPEVMRPKLRLHLASVQHGFRGMYSTGQLAAKEKIGISTSGECNIDVICSAADLVYGHFIDAHRDEIRSVAAYTVNGVDTCSGALINNTANDRRPFFLTADHCGISTLNDQSMVFYWNFENSTCRTPGSPESGGLGDGPINIINSGATFRSGYTPSDFTLVELDDPVNPAANAFYAGWDRSGAAVTVATGIHHPAVAEKRISFELDPVSISSYFGFASPGDRTHLWVTDWDYGTTEGGSSGSPLFDQHRRIVGQLHGGFAACGNDLPDWYGRLFTSWTGGGTPESRLSDWLDPLESGLSVVDGVIDDEVIMVDAVTTNEGNTGTTDLTIELKLSAPVPEPVTVQIESESATALAGEDFIALPPTSVTFNPGSTSETVMVSLIGDTVPEEHEVFRLKLRNPVNADLFGQGEAVITILNDDFITPVIISDLVITGQVSTIIAYQIGAQNTPTGYAITNEPAGMMLDAMTGEIEWLPMNEGTYTVDIIATNPAGVASATLTIEVKPNPLAVAIDLVGVPVNSAANPVPWYRQIFISHDGVDAAQSGVIGDNTSSTMSIDVTGPDHVVFWYQVSSEENYDFLTARLNGVAVFEISGAVDWLERVIEIPPGDHVVSWEYAKDFSISEGADAGWLDEVRLASAVPEPVIVSRRTATGYERARFVYQIEVSKPTDTFGATPLPDGWVLDVTNGLISAELPLAGVYEIDLSAMNTNGTGNALLTVTINPLQGIHEGIDNGFPRIPVYSDSELGWILETAITYDGVDSVGSPTMPEAFGRYNFITRVMGPGQGSFWWRSSTEFGQAATFFEIDGSIYDSITGTTGWQQVVFDLDEGLRELRWTYAQNFTPSTASNIFNRGYVDVLEITGYAQWIFDNNMEVLDGEITNDPDMDGIPNLLEYALGLDPEVADMLEGPLVPMIVDGKVVVEIPTIDDPGMVYNIEAAADVAGPWDTVNVTVLQNSNSVLRVQVDDALEPRGYLRLGVSWVPPLD